MSEKLDRTKAPLVHAMGQMQLPHANERTLANGTVLRWLDGGTQDINQLVLTWPGGFAEAKSRTVATLAAQLLREGAAGIGGSEISEALDFRGAMLRLGATEHYSMMLVASLNSMADGILPVLRHIITCPDYPERALEVYRDREVQSYLISRSKVSSLSQEAIAPLIMGPGNPLARPIEQAEIEQATRADLVECHRQVYSAAGCQAFLGGRISDKLLTEVTGFLESLPAAAGGCPLNISPYLALPPQEVAVSKPDALQSSVRVAFPAPVRSHPDYIPLRFATMALGGYFGSRLMKNIREDKGYTYGINAFLLGTLDGSYVSIAAETANEWVRPLLDEVAAELERLAREPMDKAELMRLRQHIAATLMETLDSPFAIMDYYRTMQIVGLPQRYFADQVELARRLSPEMIMEMAAKYLQPSQMRIAIAGA